MATTKTTDDDDFAVMDEDSKAGAGQVTPFLSKTRSLSDGNNSQLSPSPFIVEASRRTSKDDSSVGRERDRTEDAATPALPPAVLPVTPRRPNFSMHGLSIHMPQQEINSPAQMSQLSYMKQVPLSPKLDPSQIYASPTNILPRRSRGLDFSRAATSLHHSTLAEQSSPDTSPTIGGRAINIPRGSHGDFGADPSSTTPLRSMMGNHDRMLTCSSVGSTNPVLSDSSSNSGEDDFGDEEMEDVILNTPQVTKSSNMMGNVAAPPWMTGGSPAINSLASFRIRPRRQPKKKPRNLAALGFNAAAPAPISRSPPSSNLLKEMRDIPLTNSRRESISWAANQLHISGAEMEDRTMDAGDSSSTTPGREDAMRVVRRPVNRRGSLLPKTKGFARIRAALAEEGAPVESEFRREAEVIRQVRESDLDLQPRKPSGPSSFPLDISDTPTAQSSPKLGTMQESIDEMITDDDMMADSTLSSSFKQQAMKNSKGKHFWDNFSETGSINGTRVTPPPAVGWPRDSSSGISEDVNMGSPSTYGTGFVGHGSDSQKSETPQPTSFATPAQGAGGIPPTAAEITRRINNKRRRDDDFDPNIFKRRAVSPGMSAHNSPIMQSPLQRDNMPWGSRPGSNHGGDKVSGPPSENGSSAGNSGNTSNAGRPINGAKGRVGYRGMVDTNDGLMRMSIE